MITSTQKTIITICLIFSATILGGLYLYSPPRFQLTKAGESAFAYKMDKKTGKAWLVGPTEQKEIPQK